MFTMNCMRTNQRQLYQIEDQVKEDTQGFYKRYIVGKPYTGKSYSNSLNVTCHFLGQTIKRSNPDGESHRRKTFRVHTVYFPVELSTALFVLFHWLYMTEYSWNITRVQNFPDITISALHLVMVLVRVLVKYYLPRKLMNYFLYLL